MGNKRKSAPGIKMLKSLVLLSVCVTGMYGKYIMPGLGNSRRVRPLPTRPPPPACDSCCPAPPPVDEDKIVLMTRKGRNGQVDFQTSNWTRKRVWLLADFCMEREEFLCGGNNAVDSSEEESEEDCFRRCYNTPSCVAWTFGSSSPPHNCWLKTTADCRVPAPWTDWTWGHYVFVGSKTYTIENANFFSPCTDFAQTW